MSMGKRGERQSEMWVSHKDVTGGPGHRFYDKLNELLTERGFDREVETLCAAHYAASKAPGNRRAFPAAFPRSTACAAASRAIGTRKGEHET